MTTRTFTPEHARNLTIPATDDLLRGWVGPVFYRVHPGAEWVLGIWGALHASRPAAREGVIELVGGQPPDVALPLSSPAVRDYLIRKAADGESCGCNGLECRGNGDVQTCSHCGGYGYLRKPADLSAFRDGARLKARGWTSAELSALLLYLSWRRLEAGMGPLVGETMSASVPEGHLAVVLAAGWAVTYPDGTITAEVP
jgi:hypothetical protein